MENEIYALPDNWSWTKLKNVCSLSQGQKISDKNFPYLEVKYLRGFKEKKMIDSGNYISAGTKIILVDGENSGEIFTAPENGYMGSTFRALDIFSNVDADYFQYFVSTKKELYHSKKRGSAIPHLDKKLFYTTPFPLPPLDEQKRIVEILDKVFLKLNQAEEKLNLIVGYNDLKNNTIGKIDVMKKSILAQAFRGKLGTNKFY